ncbi:MAG: rhomboid family intramembrane serine protease [Verrucomicrobiota bacterium]|nr:rhomboid family intramembrane serine protease [Verrucomicrobiota bacterium]
MHWIDRAENQFGHICIPGLPRVIVGFNALVFVLYKLQPDYLSVLDLDPARIIDGEVWRLVTYIFIPSVGGILGDWLTVLLYCWFLWFVGNGVEQAIGPFKTTWFYVFGMIGTTIAAFLFGAQFSSAMLNSTLFFAFARFYPEMQLLLFFILPFKVKWMAWGMAALLLLGFVIGDWSYRAALIAAFANYFIFFGREIVHEARQRSEVSARRRRLEAARLSTPDEGLHRCEVCGRTELIAPDLEFRVARDGNEYCLEHLPKSAPAGERPG